MLRGHVISGWRLARWTTAALVVCLLLAVRAAAASGPLDHAGRWLVDPQGRVVVVHGGMAVLGVRLARRRHGYTILARTAGSRPGRARLAVRG